MDIRNFFGVIKTTSGESNKIIEKPTAKKKRAIVISDDEDIIPESPMAVTNGKKRKKNQISDSDSEELFTTKPGKPGTISHTKKSPANEKKTKNSMKEVKVVSSIFGSAPVKRTPVVAVKQPINKKENVKNNKTEPVTEVGIHSDDEFDKTLVELDLEEIVEKLPVVVKSRGKSSTSPRKSDQDKKEPNVTPRRSSRSTSKTPQKEATVNKTPVKKPEKMIIDKGPKKVVKFDEDISNIKDTEIKKSPKSHSKSPQEDAKSRSPQKDNKSRSPQKDSKPRSRKDSKSRSPQKNSKSRSPRKDTKSRSPQKENKSRSPQKDNKSRSQKDSKSRSPQKDNKSRSPQKDSKPRSRKDSKSRSPKDTKVDIAQSHKSRIDQESNLAKGDDKQTKKHGSSSPSKRKRDDDPKSGHQSKKSKTDNKRESSRSRSPKKPTNAKSPTEPSRLPSIKKMSDKLNGGKDFSMFIKEEESVGESLTKVKSETATDSFASPQKSIRSNKSFNVTPKSDTKSRKRKMPETPELTDEERHERKRHSAMLFSNFKNRPGPKNPGSKEIPEGKPNCLSGLSFAMTGVLDSMNKEEVSELIKKYGGEFIGGVTKKRTHLIYGEDHGPAKMVTAEKLGITIITEDDLLDLIRNGSGKQATSSSVKKASAKKTPVKRNIVKPLFVDQEKTVKKETDSTYEEEIISPNDSEQIKQEVCSPGKESIDSKLRDSNLAWVDKYKPNQLKQIIGQQGDASNAKKLSTWLSNWYANRKRDLPKPSPWSKGDGSYYKAALLSGPPGVGKTTTVTLVCKELGFDTVEFNASDTRSKSLIKEQISDLVTTKSLAGYVHGKTGKGAVTKKHVVVMDEVDGMAGNEDRGGMQELIALIKQTSVPIICMCNDKTTMKMRSLVNSCYDLTYSRPKVEQIKGAMMSICFKEGISISPLNMHQLILGANQDIRQILNLLSMWSAADKKMTTDTVARDSKMAKKDMKMGPWSVLRMVFSEEDHKTMSIHDKSNLFFHDYSMSPLFVQHNYLKVSPHCPKNEILKRFAEAADCLSIGDLVESKIRGSMAWSLLPVQAMYSSVLPGAALSGHVQGQIDFPSWLGQNSRTNKMQRLAQELHSHTGLSTSGSKLAMRLDYATHLRDAILTPLVTRRADGVQEALSNLQAYHLLREDLDSLLDITSWPGKRDQWAMVDSKVKAALTKAYNKEATPLPYSQVNLKKSKSTASNDSELEYSPEGEPSSQEGVEEDAESDSDLESDTLIKKSKKLAAKSKPDVAASSKNTKKKGKGKGKGK